MKKNYFQLLFIACIAFASNANAQCSSCTITISSTDAANHVVTSGTTLCITSGGTATGLITVASGGILCNQGTINSTDLWVSGGVFNNYGTVNTTRVLVSGQGTFNNYQTADIDSLLVTNIYSVLMNNGTINDVRIAFSDYSSGTNNGTITADYMGDSLGQFSNNASGSLTVNFDLYHGYNSSLFNYGYMRISRDFYNSTASIVETSCMVGVGRDWYNSATISGPPTGSCGGFAITGASYNSGTIGSSSQHVDICDAGNPATGLDGSAGGIASTTTFCACANACMAVGITEPVAQSQVLIQNIYPNPATTSITIELQTIEEGLLSVEVIDMTGRRVSSKMVNSIAGLNKASVDVSILAPGTYILSITDAEKLQSKQLFTVVK
jgi:hypothetical protein